MSWFAAAQRYGQGSVVATQRPQWVATDWIGGGRTQIVQWQQRPHDEGWSVEQKFTSDFPSKLLFFTPPNLLAI